MLSMFRWRLLAAFFNVHTMRSDQKGISLRGGNHCRSPLSVLRRLKHWAAMSLSLMAR